MAGLEIVVTALCLAGAIQGYAIGTAVLSIREGDLVGHRWLAALASGGSTVMLLIVASHRLTGPVTGWLEMVETGLWIACGPLVLFYVRHVSSHSPRTRAETALHLAPAIAWALYAVTTAVAHGATAPFRIWSPPVIALISYQAAHTVASIVVWRHRSAGRPAGLHGFWVPALLILLLLQHVAQVLRFLLRDQPAFDNVVPATGAASFFVLTALGLRRALRDWNRQRVRYAGSALDERGEQEIVERVLAAMETEQVFIDPELTAPLLAQRIGVPRTHLSQALNHRLGEGFQDLVSRCRIAHSEQLLADPSLGHLTIEAIGRRSGFKSRSAFYEAFRRARASTPAEYRRQRS